MRRFLTRRKLIITAFTVLLLLGAVALLGVYLVRRGELDRWLVGQMKTALAEYGVRAEIGALHTKLGDKQMELRDLKLYTQDGKEPFATLAHLSANFSVRQLAGFLGFGRKGEVELQKLTLEGLRATYSVDEKGRSNLAGLHLPPDGKEQRVDFKSATATIEVRNAEVHYLDKLHQLEGTARNLNITLSPDANHDTRIVASTEKSDFIFDGRASTDLAINLNARANERGASVESLKINSPLLVADLKGELKDWREFAYQFDAKADIKTREVARLFAPQARLSGTTRFDGKVEGKGVDYKATGKISSNDLVAQGVRIEGLSLSTTVTGKKDAYQAQHDVAIRQLEAAGFRVNRFVAAGKIAGNGEDFSWLGNLKIGELNGKNIKAADINFREALIKGRLADPKSIRVKGRVSIPTLVTADVPVGNLTGDLEATRDEISIPNFNGAVFGGNAKGSAKVRIDGRGASTVLADLSRLNLEQAGATFANKRLPLRGVADGRVNLSWQGNDYRSAVGTVNLQFTGNTMKPEAAQVGGDPAAQKPASKLIEGFPVSGTLNLTASNRRLRLENTTVQTGKTTLSVSGEIGWDRTGALDVSLDAPDAAELKTLALDVARVSGVDESQLFTFSQEVELLNKFAFNGKVSGSLDDPRVEGKFTLDGLSVKDELLGALAGNLTYTAQTVRIDDGTLIQREGEKEIGRAEFALNYPFNAENSGTVKAKLDRYPLASIVRQYIAMPIEGALIGEASFEGLPGAVRGSANFKVAGAKINERAIEEIAGQVSLDGKRIEVANLKLRSSGGLIIASGSAVPGEIPAESSRSGEKDKHLPLLKDYRVTLKGEGLDIAEIVAAASENAARSPVTGRANIQLEASGAELRLADRGRIFDQLTATITSDELSYNGEVLGKVNLTVTGRDSVAKLDLKSELLGQSYTGTGEIDFSHPDFPINAAIDLKNTSLAPVFNLLAGEGNIRAGGTTSGQLKLAGTLAGRDNPVQLEATLNQLAFDISAGTESVSDYRLTAQPPIAIKISNRQVDVGTVTLSGANTSLIVKGTIALNEKGRTDFSLNGDVNPKILQSFTNGLYADGLVRIEAAAKGSFDQPRFSGTATLQNGSLRSPDFPLALTKANGRVRFTADQAQIEKLTAEVGTGRMEMSGGAAFVGLRPDRWRFQIKTNGVRVDYPRDTRTTLDGDLLLQGNRQLQVLNGLVNVRRAEYLAEANLFEFIEKLTAEFSVPTNSGVDDNASLPPTQFDIRVIADDSLIVHTKTLDLVASAALQLRGPADDVAVGGRITITRGLIDDLLKSRYRVTNGVIEFPGVTKKMPRLNIEAETEVAGYRPIILVSGPTDQIRLSVRSEPPLPQNDVVSLITTGRLSDEKGLDVNNTQSLAATSANTIAQVATQSLSRSIERNTDRLFGLNRFSIDPLLTGRGTDPTARITVGRRVTRDLSITYSTNVASNQDQVILVEYRASDRITFVASRAQDGTFGLDMRFRQRF